jgi:hypothetical protein
MDKRFRDKDKSFWEGVYRTLEYLDEADEGGYFWDTELGEEALRKEREENDNQTN